MIVSLDRIICMAVSAAIGIGLPIALMLVWKKRTGSKILWTLVGAVTFVLFALVLEDMLHTYALLSDNNVSRFLEANPWAYVLYAGFAAGIFEEVGRFAAFKLALMKRTERKVSVMYGIGHGGIEAIILCGIGMVANLIVSVMLNTLGIEGYGALVGAELAQTNLDALCSVSAPTFLVGGIERISAIALHISLSVLVFLAAKRKGKGYLFPVAILIHAGIDCFAMLYRIGVITSIAWLEFGVAVGTVATAFYAFRLYRSDAANDAPDVENTDAENTAEETVPEQMSEQTNE